MAQRPKREDTGSGATATPGTRVQALSTLLNEALDGFDVEIGVAADEVVCTAQPEDIPAVCRVVKQDPRLDFDYLRCLSVVDYVDNLKVLYHLFSLKQRHKMVLETSLPPDEPSLPTVTSVWRAADWFEREGHDLYGVVFEGHPKLEPLLLYEGFEGYPGLRSFPFHDYDEW